MTAADITTALALIGYNNSISLTNKMAIYVPSTGASSTTWTDLYTSGNNLNINSSMSYYGNYFYKSTSNAISLVSNMNAATTQTVKTIIVIMNWGTAAATHWTILNDPADSNKFLSHRTTNLFWNSGAGGSATFYHNGINVTDGFTSDFWTNKWFTVVMTNLNISNWSGLQLGSYTGGPTSFAFPIGAKVSAVAIYSANFTSNDVANATAWGQSFYRM